MPLVTTIGFDITIFSICARSRHDAYILMRKLSDLPLIEKWLMYNLNPHLLVDFRGKYVISSEMAPKTFHEQRSLGECIQFISMTFAFIFEFALYF